jgi:hypothetical protein
MTILCVVMAAIASAAVVHYAVIDVTTLWQTYRMLSRTRGMNPELLHSVLHPARQEGYLEVVKVYALIAIFISLLLAPRLQGGVASHTRSWRDKENLGWAGALATGIILFVTNIDVKVIDLALPAAALGVWACCYAREVLPQLSGKARKIGWVIAVGGIWIMVVSSLHGLLDGWVRERVRFCYAPFYFETPLCDRRPPTDFFAGVRAGCTFVRTMDQMADFMKAHPKDPVFFSAHLEFAYAAFGRAPPRGYPIWLHYGTSYFDADVPHIWSALQNHEFAWLIFNRAAYEDPRIQQFYEVYRETPELTIMQPRTVR